MFGDVWRLVGRATGGGDLIVLDVMPFGSYLGSEVFYARYLDAEEYRLAIILDGEIHFEGAVRRPGDLGQLNTALDYAVRCDP